MTTFAKVAAVFGVLGLGALAVRAGDEDVTFHSDVSLVRVDVQVLDGGGGAITGLTADDFELRDNGKRVAIRNFQREEMPLDVLFLLDVSGSMQPHIQQVARASQEALNILGKDDRVAVMVFDRSTRLRSPFKPSKDAYRELQRVIDQESFNGGTDITGALKDSINYMARQGRREGRRAIIIVTDDQTEFQSDIPGIERMLTKNDIVLSALIAPDAMGNRVGFPGGGYPGGGYPGGGRGRRGGAVGFPGGGIGFPGGGGIPGVGFPGGGGGRRLPGGVVLGGNGRATPAGSAEIAVASGGDSFPVDQAGALEDTLERLRQRYALFFHAPAGSKEGEERTIDVALVGNGLRRYRNAELKFRRSYIATDVTDDGSDVGADPTTVSNADEPAPRTNSARNSSARASNNDSPPTFKRRPAVSEPGSGGGPNPNVGGGWRQAAPEEVSTPTAASSSNSTSSSGASSNDVATVPAPATAPAKSGGWRRATPADTQ